MTLFPLLPFGVRAATTIEVAAGVETLPPGQVSSNKETEILKARFELKGDLSNLCWPESALSRRVESNTIEAPKIGLWAATCFEVFFGPQNQSQYSEVNISPDGHWGTFDFLDYRYPPASEISKRIQVNKVDTTAHLESACIDFEFSTPKIVKSEIFQFGLACVLKMADGKMNYHALSHHGKKPDFHLKESFQILLKISAVNKAKSVG